MTDCNVNVKTANGLSVTYNSRVFHGLPPPRCHCQSLSSSTWELIRPGPAICIYGTVNSTVCVGSSHPLNNPQVHPDTFLCSGHLGVLLLLVFHVILVSICEVKQKNWQWTSGVGHLLLSQSKWADVIQRNVLILFYFYKAPVFLSLESLIDHLTGGHELDEGKRRRRTQQRHWSRGSSPVTVLMSLLLEERSQVQAGSLQCLPECIISPASRSLKMSYIHSNELRERGLFPNFAAAAPTLIQMLRLCSSSPSTH